MAASTTSARAPRRRGLIALVGVAVAALMIAVAARIGTLVPAGAIAATSSPGAPLTPTPSRGPGQPTAGVAPTEPPPTPQPTPVTVPAPLTGLPVSEAAALRQPIAVMIDDHPDARSQAGFNAASIVWQAPAEGGVPRYMLIFQDQIPTEVGPVRSARLYYIEWAAEWNAMYVHHGGSPEAKVTLARQGNGSWVWNADGFRWENRYLFRATDRIAPHNVMTDGEHLRELADRIGAVDEPLEPVWSFGLDRSRSLRPNGGTISMTYPFEKVTYRYDPVTNTYPRYVDGARKPQIDLADGEVVAPKNVVILRMFFGALNDGSTKDRLAARNTGQGEAWIATNGVTIKGTWRKKNETAPTLLFDEAGNPITLTAGQTFVQVLPLTHAFEIDDAPAPVRIPPTHQDP